MTLLEGIQGWSEDELDLRRRLESGETVVINMSQAETAPHKNLVEWAKKTDRFILIDRKPRAQRLAWLDRELQHHNVRYVVCAHSPTPNAPGPRTNVPARYGRAVPM